MSRIRNRGGNRRFLGYYEDAYGNRDFQSYTGTDSVLCHDSLSKPPHTELQDFYLLKQRTRPPGLSGVSYFAGTKVRFSNYPVPVPPIVGSVSLLEADGAYVTKALARENTETGELDATLAIYELIEIPSMIKNIFSLGNKFIFSPGSFKHSDASDTYLMNEFGIQPMLSDIMSVMSLQRSMADRFRRFNKQASGKSVGGSLENASFVNKGIELRFLPRHLGLRLKYESKIESRVWYTIHTSGFPRIPQNFMNKPRVLGLNQPISTLWNIIPWSFLIDYFTNINDFIQSKGSHITVDALCLMKHRKVTTTWTLESTFPGGPFYGPGELHLDTSPSFYETKERDVFLKPEGGTYFSPWLSAGQRSNVAALLGSRRIR